MEGREPAELIREVEQQKQQRQSDAIAAFEAFHEAYTRGDGLVTREAATDAIADRYNWTRDRAVGAIRSLVSDTLDPVQLVVSDDQRYVGIIDYEPSQEHGGYGFEEYDDVQGRRKVVVCGKCVEEYDTASEPFRVVEGVGRHGDGCDYEPLFEHLGEHYSAAHTDGAEAVEVGASLVSGTTVAGNTAFHAGNDGSGSGLDSDTVDGKDAGDLGGGTWNEDGNSPFRVSGSSGLTAILADTYDIWYAFFTVDNPSASDYNLHLRMEGDGGTNYNEYFADGSSAFGRTRFRPQRVYSNNLQQGAFIMDGRWSRFASYNNVGPTISGKNVPPGTVGHNDAVSSPLTRISLSEGGNGPSNSDFDIRVYGKDI